MVAEMHYGGNLGNTRTVHSGMGGGGARQKRETNTWKKVSRRLTKQYDGY